MSGVVFGQLLPGERRRGVTLLECLVALLLTGLILSVLSRVVISLRRGLETTTALSEEVETARVARTLLDRIAASGAVLHESAGAGEVRVRLPIGWAEPCDSVFVWRGIRAPDPERDSALVIDALSRRRRVAITDTGLQPCTVAHGADGVGRTFELVPAISDVRLIRVYESGVVRIDDAVRYARRSTPRQPLTAPVLDPGASYAELRPGATEVRVESRTGRIWTRSWPAPW